MTLTVNGPGGYSMSRTGVTNASGFVRLRTPISNTGTYSASVNAAAEDGATASGQRHSDRDLG